MANHAFAKTNISLDPQDVTRHVINICKEKLHNVFTVYFDPTSTRWIVFYKDISIALEFWLSSEYSYGEYIDEKWIEYDNPVFIKTNNIIEFRHGHSLAFMWWVEAVIRENLGAIYNAEMADEGCDIDPKPKPEDIETFELFCKGIEGKRHWLPEWDIDRIPIELINILKLDF